MMSILKYILLKNKYIINAYNTNKAFNRSYYQDLYASGLTKLKTPIDAYYNHYINLSLPKDKVLATYVWIDGSGINMRSKDRVLEKEPCDLTMVPKWSFDGSSTGQAVTNDSDTQLKPCAIYKDPFRLSPHVIVLCDTYHGDGKPTATNHRAKCAAHMATLEKSEPWFGIEQEYTMFDYKTMWPVGWPSGRGYPVIKTKFSYCGNGEHVAGREVVECHARACLYSGLDYGGSNAEVMKGSWEFQMGTSVGMKAADDTWLGRYLLSRIAEHFGIIITYHPKPMGKRQPGIGCHHNFSTKEMRSDGGYAEIEKMCKLLCDNHKTIMDNYGLGDGRANMARLTGKFETAAYDKCKWGIADRSASIRLQRTVKEKGKGFLEDRRPAGDCDPYRVCSILAETYIKASSKSGGKCQ